MSRLRFSEDDRPAAAAAVHARRGGDTGAPPAGEQGEARARAARVVLPAASALHRRDRAQRLAQGEHRPAGPVHRYGSAEVS